MNIAEILARSTSNSLDQLALADVHRGRARSMTFGELEEAAGRTTALLRQSGVGPGDTVLVFQRMSIELYVTLAAILRLGSTAMFVDPSAGSRHIDRCCALRPPRALIAASKAHLLRLTTPALRKVPLKFSIGPRVPGAVRIEDAAKLPRDGAIHACPPETLALASFTSGSTGEPKLALRTHGFLLAQYRAIAAALALEPGEVELIALPIFVLANLAARVTSVLPDDDLRRPDAVAADLLVSQICRCYSPDRHVSRAAASPAVFERIAEYCEQHGMRLPMLEKVFTGGGPVSLRLLDRLQRLAPRARITVVYGSTEAEPISTVSLDEIDAEDRFAMGGGRGLLAGRPVSSIDLRILPDRWGSRIEPASTLEFERLCQPAGQPGEIVVSGDHVLAGYLDGQGDPENKLYVNGTCWHRTGDAGLLDEGGRLWLLGRCAARVEDDRGVMYPLGVEYAALKEETIRRSAVVSIGGQRVLAVELIDSSVRPDVAPLLKSLAFARVDAIRVVKRLPVDGRHNAKIDYSALRAMLERSR